MIFILAKVIAWPDIVLLVLLFVVPAAVSVHLWRDAKLNWVSTPKDCLQFVLFTPVVGALIFCVDMIGGQIIHPLTNPIDAALKTGPFGGALTLIATPLMEIVALGSLARSILLHIYERRSL